MSLEETKFEYKILRIKNTYSESIFVLITKEAVDLIRDLEGETIELKSIKDVIAEETPCELLKIVKPGGFFSHRFTGNPTCAIFRENGALLSKFKCTGSSFQT